MLLARLMWSCLHSSALYLINSGRPDLVICLFPSSWCHQLTWSAEKPACPWTTRRLDTLPGRLGCRAPMALAGTVSRILPCNCLLPSLTGVPLLASHCGGYQSSCILGKQLLKTVSILRPPEAWKILFELWSLRWDQDR